MTGSNGYRIAGWIISAVVALFLIGPSAGGKFAEWEGKEQMFEKFGFSTHLMFQIGILEVALALLFVLPRTGFIGAVLLTAYLGGAVVTHLRIGDPYVMPIAIGVVMWAALALRRPEVWALAFGRSRPARV